MMLSLRPARVLGVEFRELAVSPGPFRGGDKQPHQPDWRKADVAIWSYQVWMLVFGTNTRQVLRTRRSSGPPGPYFYFRAR
jgi:hypothetical protein